MLTSYTKAISIYATGIKTNDEGKYNDAVDIHNCYNGGSDLLGDSGICYCHYHVIN